jgi:hypothetical protein
MEGSSQIFRIPNLQMVPVFAGPDEEQRGAIPLPGHRKGEGGKNSHTIHHISAGSDIQKHGILHPGRHVPGGGRLGGDTAESGGEKPLLLGKDIGGRQRGQTETQGGDGAHHKSRNITDLGLFHGLRSETEDPEPVGKLYYRKSFESKVPWRGEKGGAIHVKGKVVE